MLFFRRGNDVFLFDCLWIIKIIKKLNKLFVPKHGRLEADIPEPACHLAGALVQLLKMFFEGLILIFFVLCLLRGGGGFLFAEKRQ